MSFMDDYGWSALAGMGIGAFAPEIGIKNPALWGAGGGAALNAIRKKNIAKGALAGGLGGYGGGVGRQIKDKGWKNTSLTNWGGPKRNDLMGDYLPPGKTGPTQAHYNAVFEDPNALAKIMTARAGTGNKSFTDRWGMPIALGTITHLYTKDKLERDKEKDKQKIIDSSKAAGTIKGRGGYAEYKRLERKWKAGDAATRVEYPTLASLRTEFGYGENELQAQNISRPGEDPVYVGGVVAADGGYIQRFANGGDVEGIGSLPMSGQVEATQYDAGALPGASPQDIKKQIAEWLVVNGQEPTEDAIAQKAAEWGVSIPASDESRAAMQRQAIEQHMPEMGYAAGGYATGGSPLPKQDDIPAMLSEGEFVMTKDAVDAVGGPGPMYDLMHSLEGRA